jgi:hypothetical protein
MTLGMVNVPAAAGQDDRSLLWGERYMQAPFADTSIAEQSDLHCCAPVGYIQSCTSSDLIGLLILRLGRSS